MILSWKRMTISMLHNMLSTGTTRGVAIDNTGMSPTTGGMTASMMMVEETTTAKGAQATTIISKEEARPTTIMETRGTIFRMVITMATSGTPIKIRASASLKRFAPTIVEHAKPTIQTPRSTKTTFHARSSTWETMLGISRPTVETTDTRLGSVCIVISTAQTLLGINPMLRLSPEKALTTKNSRITTTRLAFPAKRLKGSP
mmetsp:Transcript_23080/g.64195  ORF Transcript_23080/g.64195 Transcript_23080/m.64195 type:complete len:202 (+) Transcript_23080:682-1287(+)